MSQLRIQVSKQTGNEGKASVQTPLASPSGGMTGDEIATLMHVRVGTVWVWLHRARAQLLKKYRATVQLKVK